MRPQLAMAALLLLMIGSSLLFVRQDPAGRGQVSVTEPARRRRLHSRCPGVLRLSSVEGDGTPPWPRAVPRTHPHSRKSRAPATQMRWQPITRVATRRQSGCSVRSQPRGGEKAASAALHEGHAARNGSSCQRAARLYDGVAERFAGTTLAEEASWHAASCYQALGELSRARAHYAALESSSAFRERASAALAGVDESLASTAAAARTEASAPAAEPVAAAPAPTADLARAKAPRRSSAPASAPAAASAPTTPPPSKSSP